jgi:hypothetical protein
MSRTRAALKPVPPAAGPEASRDDELSVEGFHPLLPEGIWLEAKFEGHATAKIFNTGKLFLRFTVTEIGPHLGVRLFRAFRIRQIVGRPGPGGKFVLGARSDLYALLVKLLDLKLRADRVSLRALRHMLFRIETRTVRTNHTGEAMPEAMQYTVVGRIERGE